MGVCAWVSDGVVPKLAACEGARAGRHRPARGPVSGSSTSLRRDGLGRTKLACEENGEEGMKRQQPRDGRRPCGRRRGPHPASATTSGPAIPKAGAGPPAARTAGGGRGERHLTRAVAADPHPSSRLPLGSCGFRRTFGASHWYPPSATEAAWDERAGRVTSAPVQTGAATRNPVQADPGTLGHRPQSPALQGPGHRL